MRAQFLVQFCLHGLAPEQSSQAIQKVADHWHLHSLLSGAVSSRAIPARHTESTISTLSCRRCASTSSLKVKTVGATTEGTTWRTALRSAAAAMSVFEPRTARETSVPQSSPAARL